MRSSPLPAFSFPRSLRAEEERSWPPRGRLVLGGAAGTLAGAVGRQAVGEDERCLRGLQGLHHGAGEKPGRWQRPEGRGGGEEKRSLGKLGVRGAARRARGVVLGHR